MITERLAALVEQALAAARDSGGLQVEELPPVTIERPRRREHGDWATNVALALAQGSNPRNVAEAIVAHFPDSDLVERIEIAGPGFLNFTLSPAWLHDVVRGAADVGTPFGVAAPTGRRVNVEYVSGNPTGPVTVVLGRHAAVGDTLARLLEATGNEVVREYYFNDAGRQVILFARSVAARYLELFGVESEFPEDGYQGGYVKEIAEQVAEDVGSVLLDVSEEERVERIRQLGAPRMMAEIKASLERFGTTFDVWFSEAKLHAENEVMAAIEVLDEKGFIEKRDDAVWFMSSRLGDDKDRVVIRANGQPTYFAADLGYLMDKFGRGFDHLIYVWGADHHGTVPRLFAAVEALGFERGRVEVPMIQIVKLMRAC